MPALAIAHGRSIEHARHAPLRIRRRVQRLIASSGTGQVRTSRTQVLRVRARLASRTGLASTAADRPARFGRIDRSVECGLLVIMPQAKILLRRRNPRIADDHPPPASSWSKETRRGGFFEMKSLSNRRCEENARFLSQLKKLRCEESQRTVRRFGPTTPTHSRILPDWLGYRASNTTSRLKAQDLIENYSTGRRRRLFFNSATQGQIPP